MNSYRDQLRDLGLKDAEYELKRKKTIDKIILVFIAFVLICIIGLVVYNFFFPKHTATSHVEVISNSDDYDHKFNDLEAMTIDYSIYINKPSRIKSNKAKTISITIIDETGNISPTLSSSISSFHNNNLVESYTTLLRNNFVTTNFFSELMTGNSQIIDNLNLADYVDFVLIGIVRYETTSDDEIKGVNSILNISILDVVNKTIYDSYEINAFGDGFTMTQARQTSNKNLLDKYKLSIKNKLM